MLQTYFSYWDDLPADGGFSLFGKLHILWLIGIAGAILLIRFLFRGQNAKYRGSFLKIASVILIVMEIYKDLVLFFTGHMELQYLPLQLCGMAIFIEAFQVFFPNAFTGELSCIVCLPGAAAALIFPDWTRYPLINFMHMHGFILHGILVMIPVLTLAWGRYRPRIQNLRFILLFFLAVVPPIWLLNKKWGTNFMFVNRPSLGSPFEWAYLSYGYSGYLLLYSLTVLFVILALYGFLRLFYASEPKP